MIDPKTLQDIVYSLDGDILDLPFWQGCEQGQFLLQRCCDCGRFYWPAACCTEHGADAMEWVPGTGRGTVHVHTVMRRGRCAATGQEAPYAVAVIELEEGPFFHSNLIGIPFDQVRTGLKVQAEFATHANGMRVPVFRPVTA